MSIEGDTITVRVPFQIRRRGGRKLVLTPDGLRAPAVSRRVDNVMVKALARAFRWRRMLENGSHRTIEELAAAEGINASYVGRVLRLTLLAPDLVTSMLDGTQPADLTMDTLMKPLPLAWATQRTLLAPR
jgi:hypothetical protein